MGSSWGTAALHLQETPVLSQICEIGEIGEIGEAPSRCISACHVGHPPTPQTGDGSWVNMYLQASPHIQGLSLQAFRGWCPPATANAKVEPTVKLLPCPLSRCIDDGRGALCNCPNSATQKGLARPVCSLTDVVVSDAQCRIRKLFFLGVGLRSDT